MAHDDSQRSPVVGASVARLEDIPLVTGRGLFAADITFPDALHMRVVRSPVAHGRIMGVDTSAARSTPGVVAVWTIDDIADLPPIDFRDARVEPLIPYRQPLLARSRVRYVGEPVAVVFADNPYQAEDAAEQVMLEIEALAPVLSTSAAPGEFEEGLTTEPMVIEKAYGDIAGAMRSAHAIVALDLAIGRHSGVPLETRGTAPPRCRIAIASRWRKFWRGRLHPCICSRAMSVAALGCAASSIPTRC